jgi:hypothetical protein
VPEAEDLIASQYADRPHLRPVLDAVLVASQGLGPVTVQARKTLVSLSTPRRVFATIQPTTKGRVDLGLRLEDERPCGRLLAARDLGSATVRIALTSDEDVDGDVLGLLRRAYLENAAPPPPRRPSRRPASKFGQLTVVVEAAGLPGLSWPPAASEYHNLHLALATRNRDDQTALVVPGRPWLGASPMPGDAPSACWEVQVTVGRDDDGFDFSGACVRGDRSDRHLFLAWGDIRSDGTLRLIRGSKLKFAAVDTSLLAEAMRPGYRLTARIRLTGEPSLTWSAGPAA